MYYAMHSNVTKTIDVLADYSDFKFSSLSGYERVQTFFDFSYSPISSVVLSCADPWSQYYAVSN